MKPNVVVHTYNLSIWEAEVERVWGQSKLHKICEDT